MEHTLVRIGFFFLTGLAAGLAASGVAVAEEPSATPECTPVSAGGKAEALTGVFRFQDEGTSCLATLLPRDPGPGGGAGPCFAITASRCLVGKRGGETLSLSLAELPVSVSATVTPHPLTETGTSWAVAVLELDPTFCRGTGRTLGTLPVCGAGRAPTEARQWLYCGGRLQSVDELRGSASGPLTTAATDLGAPRLRDAPDATPCVDGIVSESGRGGAAFASPVALGWAQAIARRGYGGGSRGPGLAAAKPPKEEPGTADRMWPTSYAPAEAGVSP